jgi:hypothetical protein
MGRWPDGAASTDSSWVGRRTEKPARAGLAGFSRRRTEMKRTLVFLPLVIVILTVKVKIIRRSKLRKKR